MMKAALVVIAVACNSKPPSPPEVITPPPNAVDRDACTSAEECTLVEACCGCSAGGKRVAIRKDAVAEYDKTRPERCGDSGCAQVISTHPSCQAEATCEAGHCKVMVHMGREGE